MNILFGFFLTFIIELIVFFWFFRKNYAQIALYTLLINLFTWPLANLVYDFWSRLFFIEIGVFVIEGFLIMLLLELNYKKAFLISLVANILSAFAGILFL